MPDERYADLEPEDLEVALDDADEIKGGCQNNLAQQKKGTARSINVSEIVVTKTTDATSPSL